MTARMLKQEGMICWYTLRIGAPYHHSAADKGFMRIRGRESCRKF